MTSHGWLLLFIEKYNDPNVFACVYLKAQLVSFSFFLAYEVNFRRSDTKKNLATVIIGALRNHTSVLSLHLSTNASTRSWKKQTDATNGSVRMRLRLSGNYLLEFINLIAA